MPNSIYCTVFVSKLLCASRSSIQFQFHVRSFIYSFNETINKLFVDYVMLSVGELLKVIVLVEPLKTRFRRCGRPFETTSSPDLTRSCHETCLITHDGICSTRPPQHPTLVGRSPSSSIWEERYRWDILMSLSGIVRNHIHK